MSCEEYMDWCQSVDSEVIETDIMKPLSVVPYELMQDTELKEFVQQPYDIDGMYREYLKPLEPSGRTMEEILKNVSEEGA